ncbi:MAG: Gfo/Idh/MocA family oxidoreductase [Candidatus Binatia bacterium]
MARLALGIIGAGKHGQRYLQHAARDLPGLTVTAVSRRDAAAGATQAAELGCRFHADWRDLVADPAVEAVVAVVPPDLHLPIARAVAQARKPLLLEKPLAPTGAAATEIVRTVRAAGIPSLMAHTLLWNAVVAAIRARLPGLGPLRALQLNQRFEPTQLDWLDDPARGGAGILMHTGVHSFDLVRHLTGREVRRVWCRTARAVTVRTEDNFLAMLEMAGSDVLVSVSGSRATLGRSGLIDVAGAEGQVVGDHLLHFAYAVRERHRTEVPLPEAAQTVRDVLASFLRVVRDGEAPRATLEDGACAVLVAEACQRAAVSGVPVDVSPLAG